MTKRGKHDAKVQKDIVQELTSQQIKRQIQRLKQLPKDFRDTLDDGKDWDDFAELTGRRTEMEEWLHGPVLCVAPLNEQEGIFFRASRETEVWQPSYNKPAYVPTLEELFELVLWAEEYRYSFIYLPMFTGGVVIALNKILSATGANLRIRGQLRDSKGFALGVVH